MPADSEPKPIDDASMQMLKDYVRKGKPRKFILMTKGAAIQTLHVFKKGPYGKRVVRARKNGFRGEVICGIAVGRGIQLTLRIAGSPAVAEALETDGNYYDEEPCTVGKLRTFFQDHSELKFKPEFEIIRDLKTLQAYRDQTLQDDDEEAGDDTDEDRDAASIATRTAQRPQTAPKPKIPDAPPAPPDSRDAARRKKLVGSLKSLLPHLQPLIAADPTSKPRWMKVTQKIQDLLQQHQWDGAQDALLKLGKKIQVARRALTDQTNNDESATSPKPPLSAEEFRERWGESREKLWKSLEQVEQQLAQLSRALLGSGDPNLVWIAEQGLTDLMSDLRASAARLNKLANKEPRRMASFAKPVLAELAQRLRHPQVAACDRNQFGIKVNVKRTLGDVLVDMQEVLNAAESI